MGIIVVWKELELYKTKIIKPFADAMEMIIKIYLMPATGVYDTVKATNSNMNDPY